MSLDVSLMENKPCEVFTANITHNLGKMAEAAGIYYVCWRPDEVDCKYAKDIVRFLEAGLEDMKARPEFYKQFDVENGWGTYDDFLPWVERYLAACKACPDAEIEVSR